MRALSAAVAAAVWMCRPAPAQTFQVHPERERRPLEVVVHPGDRLKLEAGGCLPVEGQPAMPLLQEDPNFEQGLIFVPGVTMRFVPIAELVGRDLFVPRELEFPGPARVWLDWRRAYRSTLQRLAHPSRAPRPCEDPSRAPYLDLRIEPDSTPPKSPAGSLNLELTRYDHNFLPINPAWSSVLRPDICSACDGFRIARDARGGRWIPSLESPHCTEQNPYIDAGSCRPHSGDCPGTAPRLAGHVDWGPATFTGLLSTSRLGPVHISLDGDVNFYLAPEGGAGLLTQKPDSRYRGVIGIEFNSAETVRWFRTAWWRLLPFRPWSYKAVGSLWKKRRRQPGVRGTFPSLVGRPATVIGIFGIDTLHGAHPEIHPVHAIAIQTETLPDRDVFQVFVRNWGTGGDCAGRLDARLAVHRLALRLPGTAGRTYERAEGAFSDHGAEAPGWTVHVGADAATLVVELPDNRPCSVVEGQVILRRGNAGPRDGDSHFTAALPAAEPVRLDLVPGGRQLCVQQPWFLPDR
jgi:hypothetical protein